MAKPRLAPPACSRGLWLALGLLLGSAQAQPPPPSASLYRAILAADAAAQARLWAERGAPERALPHLENLPAPDTQALRRRTEAHLALGRWAWAEADLLALHQADPRDAWANFRLGALWAASDPLRARPHLLALRGSALYRQEAAELLAVLESPQRTEQVARILALHNPPLAEWAAEFAYAWEGQPRHLALLGLLREQRGAEGGPFIQQAAAQTPAQDDPLIHYAQGIYWRNRQNYAASLDALSLAHALHADNPLYWVEIGQTLRLMGDNQAQAWIDGGLRLAQADGSEAQLRALLGQ